MPMRPSNDRPSVGSLVVGAATQASVNWNCSVRRAEGFKPICGLTAVAGPVTAVYGYWGWNGEASALMGVHHEEIRYTTYVHYVTVICYHQWWVDA